MKVHFFMSAFFLTAFAHAATTNCDRAKVLKLSNELHPVTDEFQEKVKGVFHFEQLAYYAEEVHLSSHRLSDGVEAGHSCEQLAKEFLTSMKPDFEVLSAGHNRAQQKTSKSVVSNVYERINKPLQNLAEIFKTRLTGE